MLGTCDPHKWMMVLGIRDLHKWMKLENESLELNFRRLTRYQAAKDMDAKKDPQHHDNLTSHLSIGNPDYSEGK